MVVYAWSTITTAQGLSFTAADVIVFDTGGNSTQVGVSVGVAVTTLTYGGKAIPIQNTELLGAPGDFLFTDGSHLAVNAGNTDITLTLSAVASNYVANLTADGSATSNDLITGGAGNDAITLGDAADTSAGAAGDDAINGNKGGDTVAGQAGNDTVFGGQGADVVGGTHDAAGASLTGVYTFADTTITAAGGTAQVYTQDEAGNDSLNGNIGDDTILGGAGTDSIYGGQNNDVIGGGAGDDSISGDMGDDLVSGDAGNDSAFGGDGNDSLRGAAGNDSISGNNGDDTVDGGVGNDTIYGGAGNDTITQSGDAVTNFDALFGDNGDDKITGDIGNDTIYGGNGNDSLTNAAGTGNDIMSANLGNDSILGVGGRETMYGGGGNDTLSGAAGNDSLSGDLGNDSMNGGSNIDSLSGGAGNDTMIFTAGEQLYSGTDQTSFETVIGFQTGLDKIDLSQSLITYNELGVRATFALAAADAIVATTTGSVIAVQVGSDTYLFTDSNGSGTFTTADDVIKLTGIALDQVIASDVV